MQIKVENVSNKKQKNKKIILKDGIEGNKFK